MTMNLPACNCPPLTGDEEIKINGESLFVRDFWSYCYSDLLWPTIRGDFAEFIVMRALMSKEQRTANYPTRKIGDVVDFWVNENQKIEIKSSSYLQSWEKPEQVLPKFDIAKRQGWNNEKEKAIKNKKRWSDFYVFCLFAHKDRETAKPLDTNQWKFYMAETSAINKNFGDKKKISLLDLENKLNLKPIIYSKLASNFSRLAAAKKS